MAGCRVVYYTLCLTFTVVAAGNQQETRLAAAAGPEGTRHTTQQPSKHPPHEKWTEELATNDDVTNEVKTLMKNGTEPHVRNGTEPRVGNGTEPRVGNGTEPRVGNEAELHFETPGLKRHYETWIKMIMESDYVLRGQNQSITRDGHRSHQPPQGTEDIHINGRHRILQKLVSQGQRNIDPQPKTVNDQCQCGRHNSRQSRIIGGTETEEHHYPWMVSIQLVKNVGKIPFCGGSIISDKFILTAAHCVDGLSEEQLEVRVGDHDLTTNDVSREQSFPVHEIIQHPSYNHKTTDSDIALLKLAKPLYFTWRVNPICLTPHDLIYYKEEVIVMGWGKVKEGHKLGSPRLRHATLKVLPMGKCRHNFKFFSDEITSNMLCAWRGTSDSCQGDSGGPLTWLEERQKRYFLIGVTSWGIGCGLPDYPGVYTKVTHYLAWIYNNTRESVFCSSYLPRPHRKKIKKKSGDKFYKRVKSVIRTKNKNKGKKRSGKKIEKISKRKKRERRRYSKGKSLVARHGTKRKHTHDNKQTNNFRKKKTRSKRKQRKQLTINSRKQKKRNIKKRKKRKQRNKKYIKPHQNLQNPSHLRALSRDAGEA
ncbi:uncharacterized protein [Panulirus ornatus]|uniref:uncharacterized protein n=1 Tax=Panulirus ornatus TaxID=150431 RepID=UPI003A8A8864